MSDEKRLQSLEVKYRYHMNEIPEKTLKHREKRLKLQMLMSIRISEPLSLFVFLGCLVSLAAVPGGWFVEVLLFKAVSDYIALLSPGWLSHATVYILATLLVTFGFLISFKMSPAARKLDIDPENTLYDPLPDIPPTSTVRTNHGRLKWRFFAILLLSLQVLASAAMYIAMNTNNPAAAKSNLYLAIWLLVLGLISHSIILTSYGPISLLVNDIYGRFIRSRIRRIETQMYELRGQIAQLYRQLLTIIEEYSK